MNGNCSYAGFVHTQCSIVSIFPVWRHWPFFQFLCVRMVLIFPIIGFPLSSNFFFFKFFSSCVLCSLINSFVELVAYSSVIRGCCRLQHPKSSSIKITVISTYSLIYIKGFVYIIGVYHCKIFLTAYCE